MFDGYDEGPSKKDKTHDRRGRNAYRIVSFTAETEFPDKRKTSCLEIKIKRI